MGAQREGTGEQGSTGTLGAQHQCQLVPGIEGPFRYPLPFLGPPCSACSHPRGGDLPLSPQQVSHSIRGAQPRSLPHTARPGGPAAAVPPAPAKCCSPQRYLQPLLLPQDPGVTAGLLHQVIPITACPDARPARGQHHAGVGPRSLQPPRVLREPQPRAAGPHRAADAAVRVPLCKKLLHTTAWFWQVCFVTECPPHLPALLQDPAPSPVPGGCAASCPPLPPALWGLLSLPTAPEGARLPAPSRGGHRPRDKARAAAPTPVPNARARGRDCPETLPRCLAQSMAAPSQPTGTSTGGSWGCPW